MLRKTLLLPTLLFGLKAFPQADTLVYSVVSSAGEIKGFNKVWKKSHDAYEEWYQFNDRGRGDSIRTSYREDSEGFPLYIKASGVDYMKNPVAEEFSFANGKARWKNSAEEEEQPVNGKAFYTGLKAWGGHLLKALKANNNKLKLLPFGEVEMRTVATHQLKGEGKIRNVTLLEIKGFGYMPSYSWVSENGEDFANVSEWNSTILKGYEPAIAQLLAIQKKQQAFFHQRLAQTLPQKMEGSLLITNVAVFDAKEARLLSPKDVLIQDGSIKRTAAANSLKAPGARMIDGKGKTLLPGLWDMHTHMSNDLDGLLQLAAGVTHVRDMGNGEGLLQRAKQFRDKTVIGPRVEIMSGFIDAVDPMAAPTGKLINNVEEGKKAIRDFATKGYQQIKLYSSIKPEWVQPLAEEAHRLGLRVCGHIPAFMTATKAIQNGYDEITHLNMLALNFFGDTIDTRIPLRFSVPAQRTATLDLQGKEMAAFIRLLKEKNIAVDPTLIVFEGLFTARDKIVEPKFVPIAHRFPATMQRYIKAGGGGLPVPEGMDGTYKQSFDVFLQITKRLYEQGIRILPGTDDIPGFGLHRELELYVKAGIPVEKVLQLATLGCAEYTGKSGEYGQIATGRKADLILIEGNPVKDIGSIRNTTLVITNGMMYHPAALYQAISVKPM